MEEEEYEKCPECDKGTVEVPHTNFAYDHNCASDFRLEQCDTCNGSGEIRIEN